MELKHEGNHMPDDRPLEMRINNARQLAEEFEKGISGSAEENNRRKVQISRVTGHVARYLALFNNQDELREAPTLMLDRLLLEDRLELPPGSYPSIRLNNVACRAGLQLSDATVCGTLKIHNLTSATHADLSVALTKVAVESQFLVDNCLANEIALHGCSLQDINIRTPVKQVHIDDGSKVRGICNISAVHDIAISAVDFSGRVTFTSDSNSEIDIEDATFSELVMFAAGQPMESLRIHNTQFQKGFRFGALVRGDAEFRRVKFFVRANFQKAEFGGRTSFDDSEFHCAPEFFGATLFPDTTFQKAKFLVFKGESEYAAYRELRHLSHNMLKSSQDESRFFAYEQRALANVQVKTKGKQFEGYLSKLYGLASDYGQSIFRPLGTLIGASVFFAVIYEIIPGAIVVADEAAKASAWHLRTPRSLGLALQNLFQPFAIFGKGQAYIPSSGLVVALSVVQTLLSLVLFALLVLAIRRRFRKGSE